MSSPSLLNSTILLEGLAELANREEQCRLWVNGDESQMSSFTEAICAVFDDAALTRALESGHLAASFSQEILQLTQNLYDAVGGIPEDAAPQEIIDHPRMNRVRQLASELLTLFRRELEASSA